MFSGIIFHSFCNTSAFTLLQKLLSLAGYSLPKPSPPELRESSPTHTIKYRSALALPCVFCKFASTNRS